MRTAFIISNIHENMRHKYKTINKNTQVCIKCGILRLNAYRGTMKYFKSDHITPMQRAGECAGAKKK